MMTKLLLILLAAAVASQALVSASLLTSDPVKQTQDLEGKYMTPRLMFFRSSPFRDSAGAGKRSSSGLDSLAGITLGKRSDLVGLINMEPIFGRQYSMRSMPRMYDLRWAPLDSYESPNNYEPY